ncbi:efflux RND transporter periplasmic adaptor subunit [Parasphingorhabdus sp. JC815]|uniref:HlyD family secretion protein n=1 Tax=Parasphingorhabdus sp. JC815 TaxID=3232140 RepID=UPI003459ADF8
MTQKPIMDQTGSEDSHNGAPAEDKTRSISRFWIIVIILILFALLAVGLWLSFRSKPQQVQGMVDAHEVRISSKVAGRIDQFFVQEGEMVRENEPIFSLTSPEIKAKRQQAEGALASARAVLDKADTGARPQEIRAAKAQWSRAQAAANLAQNTYARTNRLYSEGVVPRQRRDEARTNAVASSEAAAAAKAQYELALAGARSEDKAAASGQVQQASGAIAEVDAAMEETQIVAPSSGELGRRLAEVGELVPAGYPVFTITDIANPWVTITLREDQFSVVKKNAVFAGIIPALGDRKADFKVSFIAPAGDFATWRATRQSSGFDVKSFEVRLTPVKKVEGLRPGMSVLFDWPH